MKKNYRTPELEIIELEKTDIIQTSGEKTGYSLNVNGAGSNNSKSYTYNDVANGTANVPVFE